MRSRRRSKRRAIRSASFCARFPRCTSAPRARPRKKPKAKPAEPVSVHEREERMTRFHEGRRAFLKTGAAVLAATALPRVAFAAPKTIKIGLVAPMTGPLAIFTEQLPWTLDQIKAATGGRIDVGGTKHPLEIVVRDSQSNPNRAAEVAKGLILQDKVDLVTAFADRKSTR